ncbi:hypothetical protein [Paracoccus alkanivorans]|uniref:Excinuclease ABC subunit A n=1 Tax=Paracoccus alkanivorans TaxID=2116655 RepID=A0A3M0MFR3_9RHOB|nr:hypothetical protein [Paracoccus alkanivorans]RMC36518.1 hypothetical protein C9E81_07640 [Paracoccus alkanivorans]
MTLHRYITAAVVLVAMGIALPASADPGKGKGNGKHARHHQVHKHGGERRVLPRYVANCPPGLAKKNPPCVPPGQVRNADIRYVPSIGDILRVGDYRIIRDPSRYDLEYRRGWDYYRDDNYVYRVDSGTRKVLAVLDLLRAFSN